MARNHIQGYSGNILDVNPYGSLKAQSKIAGKATESSANRTTLVDSYKNLIVNKYQDDIIVVTINSISYYRVIASNTADTYTFAALPDDDGDGNEVRVVVGSVYQIIESAAV